MELQHPLASQTFLLKIYFPVVFFHGFLWTGGVWSGARQERVLKETGEGVYIAQERKRGILHRLIAFVVSGLARERPEPPGHPPLGCMHFKHTLVTMYIDCQRAPLNFAHAPGRVRLSPSFPRGVCITQFSAHLESAK